MKQNLGYPQLHKAYANLQYFATNQIVSSVPEVKICTRRNSLRCAEEINRVLIPENPTLLTKNKSLNPL
jgi:hypothetical protein